MRTHFAYHAESLDLAVAEKRMDKRKGKDCWQRGFMEKMRRSDGTAYHRVDGRGAFLQTVYAWTDSERNGPGSCADGTGKLSGGGCAGMEDTVSEEVSG